MHGQASYANILRTSCAHPAQEARTFLQHMQTISGNQTALDKANACNDAGSKNINKILM
jgi:hypothetical protein